MRTKIGLLGKKHLQKESLRCCEDQRCTIGIYLVCEKYKCPLVVGQPGGVRKRKTPERSEVQRAPRRALDCDNQRGVRQHSITMKA